MKVTKDVVIDLYPLYASGDASADSKALVEEFLRQDSELARQLGEPASLPAAIPSLPPDHEAEALLRTRRRLRGSRVLRLLGLAFTGLTVARVIEDASFAAPPVRVLSTAAMAAFCWTLYAVRLWWTRSRVLRAAP
ncbi:MAG: hypothetical protein U0166_05810 [Acidobacteriota bacterium]